MGYIGYVFELWRMGVFGFVFWVLVWVGYDIGDSYALVFFRYSVRSSLGVVRGECVYSYPCVSIWRGGVLVWWEAVLLPYRDMGLFSYVLGVYVIYDIGYTISWIYMSRYIL